MMISVSAQSWDSLTIGKVSLYYHNQGGSRKWEGVHRCEIK